MLCANVVNGCLSIAKESITEDLQQFAETNQIVFHCFKSAA